MYNFQSLGLKNFIFFFASTSLFNDVLAAFTHLATATRYRRGDGSHLPENLVENHMDRDNSHRHFSAYKTVSKTGENAWIGMLAQPNPTGTSVVPESTLEKMMNEQWFNMPTYHSVNGQICVVRGKADGKIKVIATPDCSIYTWTQKEDTLVKLSEKTTSTHKNKQKHNQPLEIYEVKQENHLLLIGVMGNTSRIHEDIYIAIHRAIHKMNFSTGSDTFTDQDKQDCSMEALIGQISKEAFDMNSPHMAAIKELKILVMYTINYLPWERFIAGSNKVWKISILFALFIFFLIAVLWPNIAFDI